MSEREHARTITRLKRAQDLHERIFKFDQVEPNGKSAPTRYYPPFDNVGGGGLAPFNLRYGGPFYANGVGKLLLSERGLLAKLTELLM